VEKNTPMLIEVIDGRSFSSKLMTHKTKALDVTIGFHTNKVVFNVISFPRNFVIIGLSWLVYIIHDWIGIGGVFILKHHNMKP
jgi:hypothetical protein